MHKLVHFRLGAVASRSRTVLAADAATCMQMHSHVALQHGLLVWQLHVPARGEDLLVERTADRMPVPIRSTGA